MALKRRKPTVIPLYTKKKVDNDVDEFVEKAESDVVSVFQYVGEQFVNNSRGIRTYKDQTGNLRSSISYVIAVDAKIENEDQTGGDNPTAEGKRQGRSLSHRLAKDRNAVVLVGVAGMEYASSLEARGRDVITNSVLIAENTIKRLIDLI